MDKLCFHATRGVPEPEQRRRGGEKFEIQDLREDLWLMNRKVSINQVVVEVNYVCGEALGSVRITE